MPEQDDSESPTVGPVLGLGREIPGHPGFWTTGSADAGREGAFRRGYQQGVAAVACVLEAHGDAVTDTAMDLRQWVTGVGELWRKALPLDQKVLPPTIVVGYDRG